MKKRIFNISLTQRYIPAISLIAFFIIITNIVNTKAIQSNKEYGKIINISGKQRMLSQRLVILATNYIANNTIQNKQNLENIILEMRLSHNYLLTKILTKELDKIYYKDKLTQEIEDYLLNFENIILTSDKEYLYEATIISINILDKLDLVVKEYERFANHELDKMTTYELYLTISTLFILLLEIFFIFRPASKEIETNAKSLKLLNNNLEVKVKEQTKELQKNIDIVSTYVIYSKTNLKGIITGVSDAFCKISEYEREELMGKPHNIIRHIDMPSSTFKDVWATIKKNKIWKGDIKNSTKNGNYYWTSAIITPEYDEQNNVMGYIAIRYDITAKKDFEQQSTQLLESEKLATLGEMIGNIAHQWRQPLSAITSTASSLKVEHELCVLDDKDIPIKMDSIILKANFLSETINTFRDFIKGEKVFKEIILQDDINQALSISTAIFKENLIEIKSNLDTVDDINITMTTGELPQVLINIFNNAKDILVENKIQNPTIILNLTREENKAIITIEDNAGGIPYELLPRIFEPYFTTKHQSQGTGLGLHMSYQIIIESLKGNLYAKNINQGAKFFIELPLV